MKWMAWLIIDLAALSLPLSGLFSFKVNLSNMEYFFYLAWLAVGISFVFFASWNVITHPFEKRISEEKKRTEEMANVVAKIVGNLGKDEPAVVEDYVLRTLVDILQVDPDRFEIIIDQINDNRKSTYRLLFYMNERLKKTVTSHRDYFVGDNKRVPTVSPSEIQQINKLAAKFKLAE